ncbi:MAG: hypothetical protein IPG46_01770 [Actinobacteria bacterium]|nr:hypothetical protein [Actinomycetota bacterium]
MSVVVTGAACAVLVLVAGAGCSDAGGAAGGSTDSTVLVGDRESTTTVAGPASGASGASGVTGATGATGSSGASGVSGSVVWEVTTPSSRGTHNTAAPAAAGGTPVATLPLTTVPSSPLAAEIEAAYVAAWEDIKVAAQLDNYETPQLADHIVEPMLEKFRGLLRGLDVDGVYLVWDAPDDSWYRIEAIEQFGNGEVVATICAYFDDVTLRQGTDEIVDREIVAARFRETFTRPDGVWRWIHRQKIDSGGDLASDCAVPSAVVTLALTSARRTPSPRPDWRGSPRRPR